MHKNRQWQLARRPVGMPVADDFRWHESDVPELQPGEILVRHRLLSLDPYMRGRMNDTRSYAKPVGIGDPMVGAAIGEVVESRDPSFAAGERVMTGSVLPSGGWQDFSISTAASLRKLPPDSVEESAHFGPLGMTGFTAWAGLMKIGLPKAGETVVVGAATGAVGSMVGQFAKRAGCRTVAIAGGAEKCAYAVSELGYDAAVDHRDADLAGKLAAACPSGIDVYFENIGGVVLEAVRPLLNDFARIPVCGLIAHYNDRTGSEHDARLAPFLRDVLFRRLTYRGFIVSDFAADRPEFEAYVRPLVAAGELVWRTDVVDGLENAPEAFIGLLNGRNFGKLLVRIA